LARSFCLMMCWLCRLSISLLLQHQIQPQICFYLMPNFWMSVLFLKNRLPIPTAPTMLCIVPSKWV
jgi:hypothetical protein